MLCKRTLPLASGILAMQCLRCWFPLYLINRLLMSVCRPRPATVIWLPVSVIYSSDKPLHVFCRHNACRVAPGDPLDKWLHVPKKVALNQAKLIGFQAAEVTSCAGKASPCVCVLRKPCLHASQHRNTQLPEAHCPSTEQQAAHCNSSLV